MAVRAPALTSEKETLILNAAQRRFAVYGLAKVTMDEIATDIGMGKASLYYYFPTKEHLFRSVIAREQAEFMQRLQTALAKDIPASEKLRKFTELRLDYSRSLLNLQVSNMMSYLLTKPVIHDLFETFASEEQRQLTEILREGKRNGEFDVKSSEALATLMLHVFQGLRLRIMRASQIAAPAEPESEQLAREMRHVTEVFLNGIRKTKISHRAERA
ncbi:MAG TPA: TetR/AcrR family transcriptional regulator [bacterium]|jgi:TetR/AcrR family transcriptional repressor of mexJK operon